MLSLLQIVLAAQSTEINGGNIFFTLVLLVLVALLLWGLANPRLHALIMVAAALILIVMVFAFIFGKLAVTITG